MAYPFMYLINRCALQIITPVVERSVTIACMTTQELVVKDFALEPDENIVRQVREVKVKETADGAVHRCCCCQ
jgi:CCR4-NOT transcription complex subunit 1